VDTTSHKIGNPPASFLNARSHQEATEARSIDVPEMQHRSRPEGFIQPWWNMTQLTALISKIDRRSAVTIGTISGVIVGAVIGGSGRFDGLDAFRSGAVAGFAGGVLGLLLEVPHERRGASQPADIHGGEVEAPEEEGNITEFPEPSLEKLHQLALTAVALSDYEEGRAKLKGNETEKDIERAAEKKAVRALDDIVERINSTKKEPMVQSEGDFEDIQEVLSEGDTSEFVTAEAAAANNALVSANDLARVSSGKNGSRLRGEDIGPAGDEKSFQGDMVPSSSKQLSLFQKLTAQANASAHGRPQDSAGAGATWNGAKVKYCFASDVTAQVKHIFLAAVNQYKVAVPCLQFVDVGWASGSSTSHEQEQACNEVPAIFVQSNPAEGCYSYVGQVEWKQSQRLQLQDPGCLSIGTAVHELGHAIGMAHEQARPDRDQNVKIHWNNIQYGMEHNFEVEQKAYASSPYDFLSIMHYDRFAFARDPTKPTISEVGHHPGELGQRVGLSSYDVAQVVAMYKAESSTCKGSALAGMGCVNKPDDQGNDPCSIDKCNSMAAKHCCACGGGVQVQCYQGQACPKTDPLPDLEAHECIEDATPLFQGQGYPCIYTNVCSFNVEFICPGFPCEHKVRSKSYEAAVCNNQYQTQICSDKSKCRVFKM